MSEQSEKQALGDAPLRAAALPGSAPSPSGLGLTAAPAIASHTPLPWNISHGYAVEAGKLPDECSTYVGGPEPDMIGIKLETPWIESAWVGDPEAAANAAFIVRACNSHYDLMEALEKITALVTVAFTGTIAAPHALDAIDDFAKAALSRARGEL